MSDLRLNAHPIGSAPWFCWGRSRSAQGIRFKWVCVSLGVSQLRESKSYAKSTCLVSCAVNRPQTNKTLDFCKTPKCGRVGNVGAVLGIARGSILSWDTFWKTRFRILSIPSRMWSSTPRQVLHQLNMPPNSSGMHTSIVCHWVEVHELPNHNRLENPGVTKPKDTHFFERLRIIACLLIFRLPRCNHKTWRLAWIVDPEMLARDL